MLLLQNENVKALDEKLLKTVIEKPVAEFRPEQVWLFGSRASGTPEKIGGYQGNELKGVLAGAR